MIFDSLQNIRNYQGIHPRLYEALEFLRDTDFDAVEDGVYLLDGFEFRYFTQRYETQQVNDTPEAHRDFIDIQYLISGKELIGVGQLRDMTEEVEARPGNDIWFYHGPMDYITLEKDMFAVFFPNDAHAPCITPPEGPCAVRKCVFKVHI